MARAAGRGRALYQDTIRDVMVRTANPLYEVLTGAALPAGAEDVVMMSLFGIHFGAEQGQLFVHKFILDDSSAADRGEHRQAAGAFAEAP